MATHVGGRPFRILDCGFTTIALNVDSEDKVTLHLWLECAWDDAILAHREPDPYVGLSAILPSRRLGHAFVHAVVAAIGKELAGQLLHIIVNSVHLEADLVETLDSALSLPALHQRDDGRASVIRISWIRIVKSDEALRIFGKVAPIRLLNTTSIESNLPPTMEGDDLVNAMTKMANIQGLKVLEKVSICHPKASVVISLGLQGLLGLLWHIGPTSILWMPSPNPVDKVGSGTVLDPDQLLALTQVSHLGHTVSVLNLLQRVMVKSK